MIGLILGTSEGKKILSLLNQYTDDIFITTATAYGGELLKDFKYKVLNTKPLNKEQLEREFKKNNVNILVDASHPYAAEITKNAADVCRKLSIKYIRYDRPSIAEKYKDRKNIILVDSYEDLKEKLKAIDGCILNTTGSRNVKKFMDFELNNRIVHRVLPSVEVMEELLFEGVKVEDIMAIKGPISFQFNCSFIKEYDAKAIILKDSGTAGGTEEKIMAAMDCGICAFVITRKQVKYENMFDDIEEMNEYIKVLNHPRGSFHKMD